MRIKATRGRTTTGKAKMLKPAQISAVLKVLDTSRDRCMFLLSVKAAMRAKEIAGIRWRHVRDSAIELTPDITKGKKAREIPIGKELKEALNEYRLETGARDADLLFPNRHLKSSRPMSANAVVHWFRYLYRHRMGFDGQYSSHSGRRTAITNLARTIHKHGGSTRDVQEIAGHASMATTERYIESSTEAKRKAMDEL